MLYEPRDGVAGKFRLALVVSFVQQSAGLEKTFHRRTDEDDNGEDAEDGAEGVEQADDAGHDEAEQVVFAAAQKPAGENETDRPGPTGENEPSGEENEEPAQLRWRRRPAASHRVRRDNHHQAEYEMDDGETGNQSQQASDNVVKNR
jgi:hypothetical protein